MAQFNDFIKNLEKELTCSICNEIYTEPKTLQCLHSFCRKCIEKWIETCKNRKQRLACPTCRSREDADVSKLRSSFYYDSLKQLFLAMRNKTSNPEVEKEDLPICVGCQEHHKLIAFCPQCQGMICTDCVSAHKKVIQLRNRHQIIMFIDFTKDHMNSFISNQVHCAEKFHTDQKLEYFCQTCQSCICNKCSNTVHDTHTKINIEEKAEEIKRLINEDLIQVNHLKKKFLLELDLCNQNMGRIESEIKAAKKEVSHHVQAQIKILKDHENAMNRTLDEMFLCQQSANKEELNEINLVIHRLDALNDQSNSLYEQNINYLILNSPLPQRCKELLASPPVLASKSIKRNTRVTYTPNQQVTLPNFGKILESLTNPSRCFMELYNEDINVGSVNQFQIFTKNCEGELCYTNKGSINVQIHDEDGCNVQNELVESQLGKFIVSYTPENKVTSYTIVVTIAGKAIRNSPKKVTSFGSTIGFKPEKNFGEGGGVDATKLSSPRSLAVSDKGEVVVIDSDNDRIVMFSADGMYLRQFGGQENGLICNPFGVVMYEDTILLSDNVHESGCRLQKFKEDGTFLGTIYKIEMDWVAGMCVSDENISILWCSASDGNLQSVIKLFDQISGLLVDDVPISVLVQNEEEFPVSIAYDNAKYFISYPFKNHIAVIDNKGKLLYKIGEEGDRDGQFHCVAGLTVYGGDMLLVCDRDNHRVQVFTQEGEFITSFGSFGYDLGQMFCPIDLVVVPDGKVLLLELGGNRVQVWR